MTIKRDQDISSSGQKFESANKVELLSGQTFVLPFFNVNVEAEGLQQRQATHFKPCSKAEISASTA